MSEVFRHRYPGIPAAYDVSPAFAAIRERVEIFSRQRGRIEDSLIAVQDLVELKVITVENDRLRLNPELGVKFDGAGSYQDQIDLINEALDAIDQEIIDIGNRLDILEGRKPEIAHFTTTDDAGDGSIEGDAAATDYTGQQWAAGSAADCRIDRLSLFYHKAVAYFYVGQPDVLIGVGGNYTPINADFSPTGTSDHALLINRDAADAHPTSAITGLDAHQTSQDSSIAINASDISDIKAEQIVQDNRLDAIDAHQIVQDGQIANRLIPFMWQEGATYPQHAFVGHNNWSGWAINETTDSIVPTLPADPTYDMPDNPLWETVQYSGLIQAGREWTVTAPVQIRSFSIWQPDLSASVETFIQIYSYSLDDPDTVGYREISEPIWDANGWTLVEAVTRIGRPDVVFGVVINTLNSGDSSVVTGGWVRTANSNNVGTDPGIAGWGTANNNGSLRISVEDGNGTYRGTELMGMVPGTKILMTDTDVTTNNATWTTTQPPVDQGTHVSFTGTAYELTGLNPPPIASVTTMRATVPVPSPTEYVRIIGGNPTHSWGTSRGIQRIDGVLQDVPNDAFGVQIETKPYTVSPNWHITGTPQ